MELKENPLTSLCYLKQDERILLLNRNKKLDDPNKDKWLGLGGHFHLGEDPYACIKREFYEESGLELLDPTLRAVITFVQHKIDNEVALKNIKVNEHDIAYNEKHNSAKDLKHPYVEYMFLFTATKCQGTLHECDEGTLEYILKKDLFTLPMWEGDRIFLKLLESRREFFVLKLEYLGEKLTTAFLNDKLIDFAPLLKTPT